MVQRSASQEDGRNFKLAAEIRNLFYKMDSSSENPSLEMHAIRKRLETLDHRWSGYSQEDAHEFLLRIISILQVFYARRFILRLMTGRL